MTSSHRTTRIRLPDSLGSRFALSALVIGASLAAVACSSGEIRVTPPGDQPANLTLFVEVPSEQVSAALSSPSFSVRIEEGGDVLNITGASLIMDQVEFGRASGECVDSNDPDDGDACNELVVAPREFLVPVDRQINQPFPPVAVEAGDYDRLELDVHPVTGEDANLIGQGFSPGTSVVVRGTFNGEALQDASGGGISFGPESGLALGLGDAFPLVEGEAGAMTLTVDVASWFRTEAGDLIDPRQAATDPELRAVVEQNMIESLSARPGN